MMLPVQKAIYPLFSMSCHNVRQLRRVHGAEKFNVLNSRGIISPVFNSAFDYKDRIALKDIHGEYTYGHLLQTSRKLANRFHNKLGEKRQQRIAFLCPNDGSYLLAQWACWLTGHTAVPLSPVHPTAMLEYFIKDSDASLIVTTEEYLEIMEEVSEATKREIFVLEDSLRTEAMLPHKDLDKSDLLQHSNNLETATPNIDYILRNDFGFDTGTFRASNALIIYTSGSTGPPKGVVISHVNLDAQIRTLVKAWDWNANDCILHALPLHHVHGIVNALLCPLAVGARCVMLPSFDASEVWKQILGVKLPDSERVNIFMGVPTMYVKLLEKYTHNLTKNEQMVDYVRAVCLQKMRLFVSGSAPLPTQIFHQWEFVTGHKILERYGMTETGMVLTNPLKGERKPGSVGLPFPGLDVRIVDAEGTVIAQGNSKNTHLMLKNGKNSLPGELQVRGSNVFKEYFQKPAQTEESFTTDGWFKTGDSVQYIDGAYEILGRISVDIIKTGGYKVSAVQVETALRDHPDISDVAVVGVQDITWGQKVAAVVESSKDMDLVKLRDWAKTKLPPYGVPTLLRTVKKIPRNAMGKINKKELVNTVFSDQNKTM